MSSSELTVVGRFLGAHGVKGWVRVFSYTDPMDNLSSYQPWYVKGDQGWQPLSLEGFRRQGKGLIAKIDGLNDRDAVNSLAGRDIAVPEALLPQSRGDEYYWRDLIDLRVRHVNGVDLGRVHSMMETGANDVLVVRGDGQSLDRRERLIPWLPDQVVMKVDLAAGELTVDWDPDF
ncbi:16S rRNA-processing protein RimM [Alcanivorax hongdengensis A-11-3]|uniref:Ribosome maturation factor RimM n=1 Tax=Alcanivorax hongdengensis A-11-3 TaxID=1177179 RepID=L0WFK1_9GAMM|nr:ribosome maturation factor RimM [Alcanivorax hongdengensis]EKF75633.1 16S rRNA-processing protein RimM [Alcanivorax hongdengensis A-11-3]